MATATIAARAGVISLSTGASASSTDFIAELRNCEIFTDRDAIDATSNDSSGWREFIQGNATWGFRAESLYVPTTSAVQYLYRNALSSGTSMAFRFFPTTSTPLNWNGTAIITHWDIGGGSNDAFAANVTGVGTDALTFSTST